MKKKMKQKISQFCVLFSKASNLRSVFSSRTGSSIPLILPCAILILLKVSFFIKDVQGANFTVATDVDLDALAINNKRNWAWTSDGKLHCIYEKTNRIFYSYSSDGGATWTEEQVTSQGNQAHPGIAVDSSDNIHIVWTGSGWGTNTGFNNIQYRKRTSGGWQAQEGVTDKNNDQLCPSIAIDPVDNVHITWYGPGWGTNTGQENIQYRKRTSGGWQAQGGVTDKNNNQTSPSITNEETALKSIVLFDSNDFMLKSSGKRIIDHIAETLIIFPLQKANIEGHADISEDNPQLISQQRTQAIRDYLIKNYDISQDRIYISYFGTDKLVADPSTPDGIAQNRRVEMSIIK
jgi:outer membrane protein OmpA-like peptidoglycan-associated protein